MSLECRCQQGAHLTFTDKPRSWRTEQQGTRTRSTLKHARSGGGTRGLQHQATGPKPSLMVLETAWRTQERTKRTLRLPKRVNRDELTDYKSKRKGETTRGNEEKKERQEEQEKGANRDTVKGEGSRHYSTKMKRKRDQQETAPREKENDKRRGETATI